MTTLRRPKDRAMTGLLWRPMHRAMTMTLGRLDNGALTALLQRRKGHGMSVRLRCGALLALLGMASGSLCYSAVARACALDSRPSAYADGQIDRVNLRVPTTSAQL